jgi:release factor glutamine methyltransferase
LRLRSQGIGCALRLLELGTGSGCIAVTLAQRLPACLVIGVELSWNALVFARSNIERHGCSASVKLVHGRWAQPVRGNFDGVISNPPYIPSSQVDHLPLDVRHEPRESLDGGADGMRELSSILAQAPEVLAAGGVIALECAENQAKALANNALALAWVKTAAVLRDLANRPRGVLITRRDGHIAH